ncbi:hypothetical protein BACOVA_03050 [Bacteroides ovatus ATCC 8483]|uniref:Uncharacterized protein n=1 Tax=Bacteroides ovatus (strain ATCC 8483 / DSM 1896 / JCM 5824 / BCRC 10623 / CCUG 4943 / NCTC 11153) TaxID=411476 RepID=A0AAN3D901_BACO1|nr:hypothetical protein BACOVA_03050 [Bacteroides ovatus ATCC 8483]
MIAGMKNASVSGTYIFKYRMILSVCAFWGDSDFIRLYF